MKAVRGLRNVFEYTTRLGLQSLETFQFMRDYDRTQVIYPARHLPRSSTVPVRGPDAGGTESFFAISGRQGDRLLLRLEVSDAHVTVSASQSSGTRTWHSQEGRMRKRFFVAGSSWDRCIAMDQDADHPDPNRAIFPEAPRSTSGGSMVMGPESGKSDKKFLITGYPGTTFEICLDLQSENRWKTVTWRKLAETFLHMQVSDPGLYEEGFVSGSNGARPEWRFGRMWKALEEVRIFPFEKQQEGLPEAT
ncbi:unnamed protein product [Symbiodinium sp. CCMP2456]|nr:unnamed protein product [Symbiodinium sp. CCMP2456]